MVDRLASVAAGVEDDAVAVGELRATERGSGVEEMAQEFGWSLAYVGVVRARDDEKVRGRLRVHVREGEAERVFEDGLDGNLSGGDFAEDAIRHEGHFTFLTGWAFAKYFGAVLGSQGL